ncbi:MAG TPA: DMT family transporter, partial [Bacteroidales bacterium]|nr:DMT family transporter [Bacteroidales bacterium]
MKTTIVKSELLLLLAALIWGFAFTAQRVGMEYMGPFLFNGIRFGLGALVLGAFILTRKNREIDVHPEFLHNQKRTLARGGIIAGLMVFAGATLQQTGMIHTTAGNGGFITGLYVVFVPILGLFIRHRPSIFVWIGVLLAAAGMYFLSVTGDFHISKGDLYVLGCAFVWAFHVLYIGYVSPRVDALKLALMQYIITSILSLAIAVLFEKIVGQAIVDAMVPLLYGGIFSVGIAYTLQIVGQKKAPPAHAAIILSSEAVFAAFGGWLILH